MSLFYTEYITFCHPLSGKESLSFLVSNLEAHCQRTENEQTRDATGKFQVHLLIPREDMLTI